MKKIIYAILFAVLPVMAVSLASCSDDDKDLPNVNIELNVENATVVDGTIYVVQGDILNVTGVTVKNNEVGKGAAVTNVKYFMDGYFIGQSVFAPYPASNLTDAETPAGRYTLGITCTVLAVDKSIAIGSLTYPIVVVSSADQIPSGPAAANAISSMKLNNN